MADKIYNVLFLCTSNSARSLIAEKLIQRLGQGRFRGFSAGSEPSGEVHPMTIEVLEHNNFITEDLRSKSWEEFSGDEAPEMDFVFTVCNDIIRKQEPEWKGKPMSAHWGIEDPAQVEGDHLTVKTEFHKIYRELHSRVSIFVNLPLTSLNTLKLQEELDAIGGNSTQSEEVA